MHAEDLLDRFQRAEDDIRRFSATPGGTVKIGVTPSLGRVLVPMLLETCADRHPEIVLQFVQGFTDQLNHWITAKELNLAVTSAELDTSQHETVPLYVEKIELVGRPEILSNLTDPVSSKSLSKVPLALDERSQHVRQMLDQGMSKAGAELLDFVEIQAINIRREFVLQGKRCTLAPLALFSSELESGQLVAKAVDLPGLSRTLHLAGPRVERMSPAELAVQKIIIPLVDNIIAAGQFGWVNPAKFDS